MNDTSKTPLSYRDAGVDIEAGERLVEAIGPLAKATARAGVMGGLGGFGAGTLLDFFASSCRLLFGPFFGLGAGSFLDLLLLFLLGKTLLLGLSMSQE